MAFYCDVRVFRSVGIVATANEVGPACFLCRKALLFVVCGGGRELPTAHRLVRAFCDFQSFVLLRF